MKNIPNILTITRIAVVPIIVFLFVFNIPDYLDISFVLFILASITDFFDGYLARIFSAQSDFGKIFDPIADKLLITSILILLVHEGLIVDFDIVAVIIIISRELIISDMRNNSVSIKHPNRKNSIISVSYTGKIKTFVQFCSIIFLLENNRVFFACSIGIIFLWISTLFSISSLIGYFKKFFKNNNNNEETEEIENS